MLKRALTSALALAGVVATGLVSATPAHAATYQTTATALNVRADAFLSAAIVRTTGT